MNSRAHGHRATPSPLSMLAACALAFAPGCQGCEADDDEVEADEQASESSELRARTEDGLEVVFAGPTSASSRVRARPAPDRDGLILEPNAPDPVEGEFTLEDAVVGLPVDGTLVVEIGTDFGTIFCDLYADRAPRTVANFVGLARGLRPFWDPRAGEWVRRPYYRGLSFHRVIPGFLIQGGDLLGDGTGTVGYTIEDESHDTLAHDRAGMLAMANHDGPNSAGGQFFITDGAAPQLDTEEGFSIFGRCEPTELVSQLARVPQDPEAGNRPLTPVLMHRVLIRRVRGGSAQAQPTPPRIPPEYEGEARGASPGPSELRSLDGRPYPEPSPLPERLGPPRPPRPPYPGLGGGHDHAGHDHAGHNH